MLISVIKIPVKMLLNRTNICYSSGEIPYLSIARVMVFTMTHIVMKFSKKLVIANFFRVFLAFLIYILGPLG